MAEDLMDKVFSFLSGDNNATDDKTNMLKQTVKDLTQNKYAKFFRIKSEEVDPSLASFLFTVYKMTYPIKAFMNNEEKLGRLKEIIVEAFMDGPILETVKRLDPSAIQARSQTTAPQELAAQIQADLDKLNGQFDTGRVAKADRCYNLVAILDQLVNYNFAGFFKKFDIHFTEGDFSAEPKFPAVKAILVTRELGELLTIIQPLRSDEDWDNLLNLLKLCNGEELVQPDLFTMLVSNLKDVQASKILDLLIQYTLKNPVWAWKPKIPDEHIGDAWLEGKNAHAKEWIKTINNAQRNTQINALAKQIFGTADVVRLENYTPALSEAYRTRGLTYFEYAEGLNYLKFFLEEHIEKDLKELCDILLIRGQWTNSTMSKEMSESIHQLLEASAPIASLDTVMSEDGGDGSRLRAAMLRVDRDRTQVRYINSIVSSKNEEALEIINQAAQSFIVIGRHLKVLIEDIQKKHPELLINWKELSLASKDPIAQRMVATYKRINYFVQLMRLCTM